MVTHDAFMVKCIHAWQFHGHGMVALGHVMDDHERAMVVHGLAW